MMATTYVDIHQEGEREVGAQSGHVDGEALVPVSVALVAERHGAVLLLLGWVE